MSIVNRVKSKLAYEIIKLGASIHKEKSSCVKWAIIGLGYMAEVFTRAIECSSQSIVVAVASRNKQKAESFAKKHNVKCFFDSYESMLVEMKGQIDVVYIATPHILHFDHVSLCLKHGYNVLCEKPMVPCRDRFLALEKLALQKNLFLMEGLWSLLLPTFVTAKKWIENGNIGSIQSINLNLSKKTVIDGKLNIYNPKMGGGVLHDFGIYALAFPLFFCGTEYNVKNCVMINRNGIDADWNVVLDILGVLVHISISSIRIGSNTACIIGEKGSIEFSAPFNRTNLVSLYDQFNNLLVKKKFVYRNEGFEYEVNEVERCIKTGRNQSENIPLSFSYAVIKLGDKINKMINSI